MLQKFEVNENLTRDGNPAGGQVRALGLSIDWQDGPIQEAGGENGSFVETVLEAARTRLEFYQSTSEGRFRCRENALAITKIEEALHWLEHRTKARKERGVEGTHKP